MMRRCFALFLASPLNLRNDRVYMPRYVKKRGVAVKRLFRRPTPLTLSKAVKVSVADLR